MWFLGCTSEYQAIISSLLLYIRILWRIGRRCLLRSGCDEPMNSKKLSDGGLFQHVPTRSRYTMQLAGPTYLDDWKLPTENAEDLSWPIFVQSSTWTTVFVGYPPIIKHGSGKVSRPLYIKIINFQWYIHYNHRTDPHILIMIIIITIFNDHKNVMIIIFIIIIILLKKISSHYNHNDHIKIIITHW